MNPVTIVYSTARAAPMWVWFIDALVNQVTADEWKDVQVVFIDGKLWAPGTDAPGDGTKEIALADPFYHDAARRLELDVAVKGRFKYLHIPPKPHLMQGPFRLTSKDWFCAANTRNTGIIAAEKSYLVCIDDLSVPSKDWFNQVKHAAEHRYCVCGCYKKVLKLVVDHGVAVSWEDYPPGVDSRWNHGSDLGIVPWHGTGLFGCSFGIPLDMALGIDGFEPACNSMGAEDYDFGIRAERAGAKFFLNRNMFTFESEEGHYGEASLPRASRTVTPDRLPEGYEGSTMSDHVLLNRVRNENRTLPILPEGLHAMRSRFLETGLVPIPTGPDTIWQDGCPLSEF